MQRSHYFENYINNLQKEIFVIAYNANYDIVPFISFYMKSDIRNQMDKPYTNWHNQSANRIVDEILSKNKIGTVDRQTVNIDAVEWLGFFYSKWHFLTGESSKNIIRFLSPEEGLKQYYMLHQLDEVEAIEICKRRYNIFRNNHRLNEYKNSAMLRTIEDNPLYYSFLATRLLCKLKNEQKYKDLQYVGDEKGYDFIDDENDLGVKIDILYEQNKDSILQKYENSDNGVSSHLTIRQTIYFCFVFSSIYTSDYSQSTLSNDINKLKEKFPPHKRHFDYLYFFMDGKLYEITSSNELYVYYLPISNRLKQGIYNEMKKYHLD